MLQRLTIRVNILSQKHYFCHTICNQCFDFFHDCFRLAALLSSSYIRHDAIAAEIIAAKHNIYTCFKGIFTISRHSLYDLIRLFPDVNDLSFCV